MTRSRNTRPLAALALALSLAACPSPKAPPKPTPPTPTGEASIRAEKIVSDIRQLADPSWEGRGAGTKGLDQAAAYIEARFQALKLEPGVNGSYQMPFELVTGAIIGDSSQLSDRSGSVWRAPYDFIPLAASESGAVEAELVLAGYGVSFPEKGHDDYAGLEVKDKIVLVWRGLPDALDKEKDAQSKAALRYKAFLAKEKGAKAVIFLSQPPRGTEPADDPLLKLQVRGSLGGSGILAVHARRSIAAGWLRQAGIAPNSAEAYKPRALGVTVKLSVELRSSKTTVHNVVAVLPGKDPTLAKEAVVIGAHYDHLGFGGEGSLAPEQTGTPHVGADDNGSGTAALLAIAEAAATAQERPARSLVFIAFAGEELGLLGSAYYVEHPSIPVDKIAAMLNMDMVGRLSTSGVSALGSSTAKEWDALLTEAAQGIELPIVRGGDGYGPSDHTSFYAKGIPIIHFFTGAHADYHKPSDTWDKINGPGVEKIATLVYRVATKVADQPARLTAVIAPPPAPSGRGDSSRGYGAYLGTIPDFAQVPGGVKLTGVRPGSPAETAGLKGGDILTGIGGKKIGSLEDMTYILRELRPGDEVELTFIRDGKEMKATTKLGKRS